MKKGDFLNYLKQAKQELEELTYLKTRISILKHSQSELENALESFGSPDDEGTLLLINKRNKNYAELSIARTEYAKVMFCLDKLEPIERSILEAFYIKPSGMSFYDKYSFAEKAGYSLSNIYKIKNKALRHFSLMLYGQYSDSRSGASELNEQ